MPKDPMATNAEVSSETNFTNQPLHTKLGMQLILVRLLK